MKIKNILKSILSLLLCIIISGCVSTVKPVPSPTPYIPQIEDTEHYLVKNGASDYVIVVDYTAKNILLDAVRDVILFLKNASGAKLSIAYGRDVTYNASSKFIVFGCNSICEDAGLSIADYDLGVSGYRIVTKDKSVFIMANSEYGLKNGAYDFLTYQISWDIYSADMIYYTKSENFFLKDFDIWDKPDYEFRRCGDLLPNDARRRMKFEGTIFAEDNVHTGFIYLPKSEYQSEHPDWYATNGLQLCYTARGNEVEYQLMLQTMLQKILVYLETNPVKNVVIIGQEDESKWCSCDECQANAAKYKTDSAVMIKFTNDLALLLENYDKENDIDREVEFCVFSYQNTINAPVQRNSAGKFEPIDESVVLRSNVGVYYAPMYAKYTESFYSDDNTEYRNQVEGWAACTDKFYLFLYGTYFWNYLLPFNNYYTVTETYKYFKELGAVYYYELRQHNNSNATAFSRLKSYIEYKMLWDTSLNYFDVVDRFFHGYFGPAAPAMRQYFDELTNYINILAEWNNTIKGIWGPIDTPNFWKFNTLIQWLDYINEAYSAIESIKNTDPELYAKIYDNITLESITVRYALIEFCYDKYSANALYNMKTSLYEDMIRLGVNRAAESKTTSELMQSWGI